MRWQPKLIDQLARVRSLRLQLAELEQARADERLAACREAEQSARQEVENTTQRSDEQVAQADRQLLSHRTGGRLGITDWHRTRTQAQSALGEARARADEATSDRLNQELACSAARKQSRQRHLEVERTRMLQDALPQQAG